MFGSKKEVSPITWTPEAEKRLKKAPFFLRKMVRSLSEKKAIELGITVITPEVLAQFKDKMMTPMAAQGTGAVHDEVGVETKALAWTREATERLETVPQFMRSMIKKIAEEVALERGHLEVDMELLKKAESLGDVKDEQAGPAMPWTDAATVRLEQKIAEAPEMARDFVRDMLKNDAEDLAREMGIERIDLAAATQIWDSPKSDITWSVEAEKRLMTSPDFVRSGIKKAAERRARKMGLTTVTSEHLTQFRNKAMMKAMKRLRTFGYDEMTFDGFEDAKENIRRLQNNPEAAKRLDDIKDYMGKKGKVGLIDEEMLEQMKDYLKDPSKKM
ncbi:MAG: PCP reductase family protein [Nitrospirota bacterium]|nr:PCP reductase family protein [Nitrospirota bacterium]